MSYGSNIADAYLSERRICGPYHQRREARRPSDLVKGRAGTCHNASSGARAVCDIVRAADARALELVAGSGRAIPTHDGRAPVWRVLGG
jgi:hypothetical protein